MDRRILLEYMDRKKEITDLRRRIADEERRISQMKKTVVADTVTTGKKGRKPIRTIRIQGSPKRDINRRSHFLERRKARLEQLEDELCTQQEQAEEYIREIPKSEIRTIFRLYYLDDMTWAQVAQQMNRIYASRRRVYTDESCRKKHDRYLQGEDLPGEL